MDKQATGEDGECASSDLDPIAQNTDSILAFKQREEGSLTYSQRVLESVGGSLGRPAFFGATAVFIGIWIGVNMSARRFGFAPFDVAPFPWLQGIIGLAGLFTANVVLIRQNRLAKMEDRRAHLELQVNLLTEQKASKLINLIEELRRDLPMIDNRHDAESAALQQPTDPETVLAELDRRLDSDES